MQLDTFVLSKNYRCLSNIVDFAANSVRFNNARHPKSIQAFNEGGRVYIQQCYTNDLNEMSKVASEYIEKKIAEGVKPSEIAVLCRNNVHLTILGNMLVDKSIYCTSASDMKLTNSFMYKDIKNLMDMCTEHYNFRITKSVLWKLCMYMGVAVANSIGTFQDNNGLTLKDTLAYILNELLGFQDAKTERPLQISTKASEKMRYTAMKFKDETIKSMRVLYGILCKEDNREKFADMTALYVGATEFMYKNADKSRSIRGIIRYVSNIINEKGFDEAQNYLRVTEQLESGKFAVGCDTVTLMTMHGAKGKEWKYVVVFACDNEAIPGIDGISKMIGKGVSHEDIYSHIDEERRLYYVACTRAKDELMMITSLHPSTFILESLGKYDNINGTNNVAIMKLVENGDKALALKSEFPNDARIL